MNTPAWHRSLVTVVCALSLAACSSSDDKKPAVADPRADGGGAPMPDGSAGKGDSGGPAPMPDGGKPPLEHDAGGGPQPSKRPELLTRSYDRHRTGANLRETVLNTSNVRSEQFGKLFELPVDDQVYAQILYVSDLPIAGGTHDVIYVATVNNTVYAFDAHQAGAPLWTRNFNGGGRPTRNSEVGGACNPFRDFSGNIGIVGTPVIDGGTSTMYFVTRGYLGGKHVQTLRAIDIVTGEDKVAPRDIDAIVDGTGRGSVLGKIRFDPLIENQRLSLGLSNGRVYMGWAGFCDTGDYHGWFMAYDAATLEQVAVFNPTPGGWAGGLWQAGAGAVFDDHGDLFVATGNGDYDGVSNFGQTVLKLDGKTLEVLDHFAPSNFDDLNYADWDLGSAGPTWLPGTEQVVLGGKEGKLYLLDVNDLGKFARNDTQVPQSFQVVSKTVRPNSTHHLHNTVVVWEGPAGLHMYVAGENDYLSAYRYDRSTGTFELPAAQVSEVLPPLGMPGGMLTLSADGNKAGTGIVWATTPRAGDANQNVTPGILRAYHAETLDLLWESSSVADDVHDFAKFNNPSVVNGKVYVASFSRVISVYGLRSGVPVPPVNLTGEATATSDAEPCGAGETADKVVDGRVFAQDGSDKFKWCTHEASPAVVVDLGAPMQISRVVLRHAGAGGESIDLNSRAFTVQVGATLETLSNVATVLDNRESSTIHDFPAMEARYVQVRVTDPTQNGNNGTRLYEIEVYAP